jgi:hypothetical protein
MIKISNMKRLIIVGVVFLIGCAAQDIIVGKRKKDYSNFSVDGETVMFNKKPIAKYQAKTYSLDGGELVEEYNLLLLDNNISNKQLIGDLIDFVSDRHQGAEVEVEIDSHNSAFKL